jgi:hypothetical protein
MGLDAYIRRIHDRHIINDFEYDVNAEYSEVLYWRKNHKLHTWMNRLFLRRLYEKKGNIHPEFNCVPLFLDEWDLQKLMSDSSDVSNNYYRILNDSDEDEIDDCIYTLQNYSDYKYFYYAWY